MDGDGLTCRIASNKAPETHLADAKKCVSASPSPQLEEQKIEAAAASKRGKRKRRRCVPGLIISTDARRGANDKMHAIYPLMRAAPVFASVDAG